VLAKEQKQDAQAKFDNVLAALETIAVKVQEKFGMDKKAFGAWMKGAFSKKDRVRILVRKGPKKATLGPCFRL
jgi:ribosome-associated translation inhibitor RaiA